MKIWCLFSIQNDYYQPENNLEAWWVNKPTFEDLAMALDIKVDKSIGNVVVGKIIKGFEYRYGNCYYRLEEIPEGKLKERI